jgi:protease IV
MRDFLKQVFATLVGMTLFGVLGVVGLMALIMAIAAASSSQEVAPLVEKDSLLAIDLAHPIQDTPPSANPRELLGAALSGGGGGDRPMSLRSVVKSLESAAKDDRIKGVYLYGSSTPASGGYATFREVRKALQIFKDSGKPIYAFDSDNWSERDYYLASVANQVILNPAGYLELNGLSLESPFFAGALQKYGIGVQPLRVGKYKSAIEPFIRTSSSPEDKEQRQKLAGDLWAEFLESTAKSRKLTPQKVQEIADSQVVLMPEKAKELGLADQVYYPDQLLAELHKLTGQTDDKENKASFRHVDLTNYAETVGNEFKMGDRIAIVYAEGEIVSGASIPGTIGKQLSMTLRRLREDEEVKAVVLRVNSPGGVASTSEKIAREVMLLNQKKPVIVSMGDYAASGGYEISTFARQIFAEPNTVTGSIGTFGLLINVGQLANNNGVTWDGVKTGKFADIQTVSRPKTPEELAIAQRVADRVYDHFLTVVANSRKMTKEKVDAIAQGRVWSGVEAKKVGLVDELGGLKEAIAAAAKAANLKPDVAIVEYPQPLTFEERLVEIFGTRLNQTLGQVMPKTELDPVSAEVAKLEREWKILRQLNDPQGIYNRLPLNFRVE